MNRKLFLAALVLLMGLTPRAWAYDFSAECPSGQTLYYNIVDGEAQVTYESYSSATDYYQNYTLCPVGDLAIPSTVTYEETTYSVTSIGGAAFYGCSVLTSVSIPNSITSIGNSAFNDCSGLTSITLPNSITEFGVYAFKNCSNLTAVHYTGNISDWCGIRFGNGYSNPVCYARKLYINNTLLTDLVIPDGITEINNFSFINNKFLRSVSLPNTVKYIGWSGFALDSALTTFTLPESIDSLGPWALWGCAGLRSIRACNPVPPAVGSDSTFARIDKTIPVYVPRGSKARYVSAPGWSQFTNFVESDMNVRDNPLKPFGDITIASRDGAIYIDGEATEPVSVYDISGRMIYQGRVKSPVRVPTSGIYLVKVGDTHAQKVLVR